EKRVSPTVPTSDNAINGKAGDGVFGRGYNRGHLQACLICLSFGPRALPGEASNQDRNQNKHSQSLEFVSGYSSAEGLPEHRVIQHYGRTESTQHCGPESKEAG